MSILNYEIINRQRLNLVLIQCASKIIKKARQALFDYFSECLERGIETNEFRELTVSGTANMLVALTNGLLRQKIFNLADTDSVREATIDFCRASLTRCSAIY